jgi:FixJ family two-component response regulator
MPGNPARLVAIVEDDEGMRRAVRRILETEGYVTEQHATAEEFLSRRALSPIGCLVLDVHLPGISGIELMYRLRSMAKAIPVVLITGLDVGFQRPTIAGAEYCLVKPFPPEVLLGAVERCMAQCSERRRGDENRG